MLDHLFIDLLILGGTTSLSNVLGSSVGASMSICGIPGSTTLGNWLAGAGVTDPIMPELDGTSTGPIKTSGLEDLPARRESDKGVSVEVRLVMNTLVTRFTFLSVFCCFSFNSHGFVEIIKWLFPDLKVLKVL